MLLIAMCGVVFFLLSSNIKISIKIPAKIAHIESKQICISLAADGNVKTSDLVTLNPNKIRLVCNQKEISISKFAQKKEPGLLAFATRAISRLSRMSVLLSQCAAGNSPPLSRL